MTRPTRSALALARRSRQGMSLVEIMVVIAIIGILTTVIAVNVNQYFQEANADTTRLAMRNMGQALQTYSLKHNSKYPGTADGLAAAKRYFENEEVPKDAWGNEFRYFSPGTHGEHPYEIVSLGSDGAEGGTGCAADIFSWETDKKGCED